MLGSDDSLTLKYGVRTTPANNFLPSYGIVDPIPRSGNPVFLLNVILVIPHNGLWVKADQV